MGTDGGRLEQDRPLQPRTAPRREEDFGGRQTGGGLKKVYIHYFNKEQEQISLGPFITISQDGFSAACKFVAYLVQTPVGQFKRITVPQYHYISRGK